jgi:hypothetical protein
MTTATAARAKGRCPECGRIISGRAVGIQRAAADRRFVALSPHMRAEPDGNKRGVPCLLRGGRRVVPRIRVVTAA